MLVAKTKGRMQLVRCLRLRGKSHFDAGDQLRPISRIRMGKVQDLDALFPAKAHNLARFVIKLCRYEACFGSFAAACRRSGCA